jgi:hypothetical protein
MTDPLREKLNAYLESRQGQAWTDDLMAIFESERDTALAVRMEAATNCITAKMVEIRDSTGPHFNNDVESWFRNNLPNLYVVRENLRSLSRRRHYRGAQTMSAELREKLILALAEVEQPLDPEQNADAVLPIIESERDTALAVRTEAACAVVIEKCRDAVPCSLRGKNEFADWPLCDRCNLTTAKIRSLSTSASPRGETK